MTQVLAHWSTVKPAYRVTLEDGTELVSSGDHRFLTDRGWKHVTGTECGAAQRHHLTRQDKLIGTCGSGPPPGREALVCSDLHDSPRLQVASVDPLGVDLPMFDITTGSGDFVASGVVSHNCFARPTHEYLGLGIGEDFEKKIVVKVNAVERLRAELAAKRWSGQHIAMGTNTDPYQRCEGKYRLTRGIVEELGKARNPFSILTKSTLILRDLDLLKQAASRTEVHCNLSIGTLDEQVWRLTEPGTPHPRRRVEAVRRLNEAGIPCGVLVAPILPGLSDGDDQLEEIVTACVEAGATSISPIALHLRPGVRDHFLAWLRATRPRMAADYERRYRRSYLPSNEQAGLAERVRRFADAARGPVRVSPPAGMRGLEARGERSHLAPSSPPSRQLDLGL